jgi:hypothetical protein
LKPDSSGIYLVPIDQNEKVEADFFRSNRQVAFDNAPEEFQAVLLALLLAR